MTWQANDDVARRPSAGLCYNKDMTVSPAGLARGLMCASPTVWHLLHVCLQLSAHGFPAVQQNVAREQLLWRHLGHACMQRCRLFSSLGRVRYNSSVSALSVRAFALLLFLRVLLCSCFCVLLQGHGISTF